MAQHQRQRRPHFHHRHAHTIASTATFCRRPKACTLADRYQRDTKGRRLTSVSANNGEYNEEKGRGCKRNANGGNHSRPQTSSSISQHECLHASAIAIAPSWPLGLVYQLRRTRSATSPPIRSIEGCSVYVARSLRTDTRFSTREERRDGTCKGDELGQGQGMKGWGNERETHEGEATKRRTVDANDPVRHALQSNVTASLSPRRGLSPVLRVSAAAGREGGWERMGELRRR